MGIPYEEIAVLMRTRALTACGTGICHQEYTIPHHWGVPFFARREIKDILAYLRLSRNPMDRVSLKRILTMKREDLEQRAWRNCSTLRREQANTVGSHESRSRVAPV